MTNAPLFTFADGSTLYATTAKWIIRQPVWEGNRTLDPAHATTLQTAIRDPRTIQGPFSVVTHTDELTGAHNHSLIDGQHRQEVLRQYFIANPTGNTVEDFPVLCRRYMVTSHDEAVAIFQTINHAKPMVYKDSPTERLHAMVTALQRAFVSEPSGTGALRAMIRPHCNRPALSTEHLEAALKTYGIPDKTNISPADVVAHAEKMNAWYAENPERIPVTVTKTIWERATLYGFFLGLDPRCAWLQGLIH